MTSPADVVPARRSRAGGLLLLALVLIGLLAAGGFGWHIWQGRQAGLQQQAAQRRATLEARLQALHREQRAQGKRLQQAETTNRLLRDELLGLGQRAALLEDSVARLTHANRDGAQALRLDEVELLLSIGQQRLQLDDDVEGARRALALAAPLLAAIDDPAYLNLRQSLAQERDALAALAPDPRLQANALLEQLLAKLPQHAPAAKTPRSQALPWYRRLLQRVVHIQPTATAGLSQRADREAALAALQIEASLARAAIARRDAAALASSLARIDGWLQRLLAGSPQLADKQATLAKLRKLPLHTPVPLAGSTLAQLRTLRGG